MQIYHFTIVAAGRRPVFMWDPHPRILLEILFDSREGGRYLLHEFAVLPDQVQALVTPHEGASIESVVDFIRQQFVDRIGKQLKQPVWQDNFDAVAIANDDAYSKARHAIHLSPVRAGLATRTSQYAFSSANPAMAEKISSIA